MGINAPEGPGGPKVAGVQADWSTQGTTNDKQKKDVAAEVNPGMAPPVASNLNQFAPQHMARSGSDVTATNPSLRVSSEAMLPPGADVILASGGAIGAVTGSFGAAVDHLDPDKPVEPLDKSMVDLLAKFYSATDSNPDRVQALSRAIDEAFA